VSGVEEDRTVGDLRRWVSKERDRARREATDHHLRETFPSHPDALPASPTFKGRGVGGRGAAVGGRGGGIPATITVSALDVEVPPDGYLIQFQGIVRENLMAGTFGEGDHEIATPYSGTWQARIEFAWEDWSGGHVEFWIDGVRVWPVEVFESAEAPEAERGPYQRYEGVTPTFPVDAGSKVSVRVVQTSGGTKVLRRANLSWTLLETPAEGPLAPISKFGPEFATVYLRGQNKIMVPPAWPSSEVLNADLASEGTRASRYVSSPDGSMIAVGFRSGGAINTGGILVVRWSDGTVVSGAPTELPTLRGPWEDALNIGETGTAWSPDGHRIAFARFIGNVDGHDEYWCLDILNTVNWTWETGWPDVIIQPIASGTAGAVAAWSPDSRKLAFIQSGRTHVVDADTKTYEADWPNYGSGRAILAWSPGGDRLAVYHEGENPNALKVIDVATKTTETGWPAIGLTSLPLSLAWSPDGKWLAWSGIWSSNTARSGIIDVETKTRDTDFDNEGFWEDDGWSQMSDISQLRPAWAWQKAGRFVVLGYNGGRTDRIFDVDTGEIVANGLAGQLDGHHPPRIFPGLGNGVTATAR
jgi:hypothetical protein